MRRTMRAVCEKGISWTAKALLVYLCERANITTGLSWAKPETIYAELGMSRATFYRAWGELGIAGLIVQRPDLEDHPGAVEVYPQSQSETDLSQSETNLASQSETKKSQVETESSQSETKKSQVETAYKGRNYSGTDHELIMNRTAKIGDFWPRFVERCGSEWGLPPQMAALCAGQGLIVPMPEQNYLMGGYATAKSAGHGEADFMKLADFVAAGGVSWRGAAWQQVARNFYAELSKALKWSPANNPRREQPPSKIRDNLTSSRTDKLIMITTPEELEAATGIKPGKKHEPPQADESYDPNAF